ncbi:hypothetical protein ACIQVT_01450 [Streptomyces sp. NPDC100445]|uniref:hypothetical protein n=1 Tax=Streptomyces sp. NPDC100445 TaxID=3366102 RepID=UPI003811DE3B
MERLSQPLPDDPFETGRPASFGGDVIETGIDSYRLAMTQAQSAAQDGKAG